MSSDSRRGRYKSAVSIGDSITELQDSATVDGIRAKGGQAPDLQDILLAAEEPDSMFQIKEGIMYMRKQFPVEDGLAECREAQDSDILAIVVPKQLRRAVIQEGHDQAGHMGVKKTKKIVKAHFYWPRMAHQITQYC